MSQGRASLSLESFQTVICPQGLHERFNSLEAYLIAIQIELPQSTICPQSIRQRRCSLVTDAVASNANSRKVNANAVASSFGDKGKADHREVKFTLDCIACASASVPLLPKLVAPILLDVEW